MADGPNQPAPARLEIRKYPNRRYYDSTRSRHVTRDGIYALVRDGYEVQISDSRTGTDITARVLAQILIDLDPPKLAAFPVPLLHRLLRSDEQRVGDFVRRWFSQPLAAFLFSQPGSEPAPRPAPGVPPRTGPTAAGPAGAGVGADPRASAEQDLRQTIDEMRRQFDDLRRQLAPLPAEPAQRPPSSSPPRAAGGPADASHPHDRPGPPKKRPGRGPGGRPR